MSGVLLLSEYQRRRTELEGSGQALEQQRQRLKDQVASQAEVAGLAASAENFCRRVQQSLATANFEQKRKLVELLIDALRLFQQYAISAWPRGFYTSPSNATGSLYHSYIFT